MQAMELMLQICEEMKVLQSNALCDDNGIRQRLCVKIMVLVGGRHRLERVLFQRSAW